MIRVETVLACVKRCIGVLVYCIYSKLTLRIHNPRHDLVEKISNIIIRVT
jgi:hypothetical protein